MKLLNTGYLKLTADQIEELKAKGHELVLMESEKDEVPCPPEEIEGMIANVFFWYHDIEPFTNLKFIQLLSAGYDRVPMDYITKHGIEIHNAEDVYSIPIAEHVIGSVLQLYRQSRFFEQNQKNHGWAKRYDLLELNGKRVVILGCGNIGRACAKRFKAFECEVIGLNRSKKDYENFDAILPLSSLKDEAAKADVLVVAIPITEETRGIIDADVLGAMKETAVLVNIARGTIVDEEALIKAMPNLGGAVLDVFNEEPLDKENPLWDMENVIITPHNSFVGDGNDERMWKVILGNL